MKKCKTEADLHDEYARVCRMCEGTKVKPIDCWKLDGQLYSCMPFFDRTPSSLTFARDIVEDKPVFEGDVLYHNLHGRCIASELGRFNIGNGVIGSDSHNFSWSPPKKKTFPLNGDELPSPDGGNKNSSYWLVIPSRWSDGEERNKVERAINKLLSGE